MQPSRNIAGRAGRWSAKRRKTAILGWIAFVVLAFMVGGQVGTKTLTDEQAGVGESGRADRIVADAYPKHHDELVLIQSTTGKYTDPAFRATVADVRKRLAAITGVAAVSDPYGDDRQGAVAPDGRTLRLSFEIPGDPENAKVAETLDATVAAVDRRAEGTSRPARRAVGQW
jgi:RND superfamily putative drug exporter